MPTMFDAKRRHDLLTRLRRLDPNREPLWGRLTARQMPPHLIDQMRITLGEVVVKQRLSSFPVRYPPLRQAALYWLPWPKGRIQGPAEGFLSQPTEWNADLDTLEGLVERFVQRGSGASSWPEHPAFGRLNGREWGVFCYRHFEHHISQFGG